MQVGASADRSASTATPKRQRSAVTNGRRLFVEGDGTSAWSRRYRDLVAGHASDLGGADILSAAQLSLVRRASAIELECEQMEGRLSKGESVDLDIFTRSASHLRRILETLGIERKLRDVTPQDDVSEWIETRLAAKRKPAGEAAAADASAEAPDAGEAISDIPAASETDSECAEGHGSAQAGAAPRDAGAHSRDVSALGSPVSSSSEGGGNG